MTEEIIEKTCLLGMEIVLVGFIIALVICLIFGITVAWKEFKKILRRR